MTKKKREQVVELLRCMADQMDAPRQHYAPLVDVAIAIGHNSRGLNYPSAIELLAKEAMADVYPYAAGCSPDRVRLALEAATRVEEGNWP